MVDDFAKLANTKLNEYLLKTEELFVLNKNSWVTGFSSHFQDMCKKIQKWQDEVIEFTAISYLEYLMLYTNFVKRRYTADIFVFGNKSYLDKCQHFIGSYNISFMFVYFEKLWDDLSALKKRYPSQVSAQDVTSFMIDALPDFYSYLTCAARIAILNCINKSQSSDNCMNPLTNIRKTDRFIVNVGDYLAKTETVYEEQKNKDAKKLIDWFEKKLNGEYIFGDYSNLDFTGGTFEYMDFRYARFQNSTLKDVNFEGSALVGVDFRDTNMERSRLDNCSIHEANFSNAILKNTSFINTKSNAGLVDEKEWKCPGFLPTNFSSADLTKAVFRRADLKGADFRRANLTEADLANGVFTDADFTDAILRGSNFSNAILDNANLNGAITEGANFTGAIVSNTALNCK